MNAWGLFIVMLGLGLVYLGITAKAGNAITHVKAKAA
jgi:hypothetical protein